MKKILSIFLPIALALVVCLVIFSVGSVGIGRDVVASVDTQQIVPLPKLPAFAAPSVSDNPSDGFTPLLPLADSKLLKVSYSTASAPKELSSGTHGANPLSTHSSASTRSVGGGAGSATATASSPALAMNRTERTSTAISAPQLPAKRRASSSPVVGTTIGDNASQPTVRRAYYHGGDNVTDPIEHPDEYFDPETEEWTPIPTLPDGFVGDGKYEDGKWYYWNGGAWVEYKINEPSTTPIGDCPVLLLVLCLSVYVCCRCRRKEHV